MRKHVLTPIFLIIFTLFLLPACDDVEDFHEDLLRSERERDQADVLANMNKYYYWYREIPDIDSDDYPSVPALFEDCLWTPERGGPDLWSFILTQDEYDSWVGEGEVDGYGVTFVRFRHPQTQELELRVGMVYQDGPLHDAGILRGYRLESLNSIPASAFLSGQNKLSTELQKAQGSFVFHDLTDARVEVSLNRGTVYLHPASHWAVWNRPGRKIGYLMFTTFMVTSDEKRIVQDVFDAFAEEGIDDLILDLRYNGGGELGYTRDFAGFVVPSSARDDVFIRLYYNDKVDQDMNSTYSVKISPPALNLPRIVIITSDYTASASESLIMGLSPYMDVVTVGTTSSGKPAGMNGFSVPKGISPLSSSRWVMFPITFVTRNKLDQGEYYDGLEPDFECADDVLHPIGTEEACIQSALQYLETGTFPVSVSSRSTEAGERPTPLMGGFRAHVGFY